MLRNNLQDQAVEILAIEMTTDTKKTFSKSSMNLIGADMAVKCSERVYNKTGLQAKNFDVVELHDCFSANELCTYEALKLCPQGQAGAAIDRGDFTYGG